jgi:hypothetical protein
LLEKPAEAVEVAFDHPLVVGDPARRLLEPEWAESAMT